MTDPDSDRKTPGRSVLPSHRECVTGDHTPGSTLFISSWFCRSAVWTAWLVLCSGPHQARRERVLVEAWWRKKPLHDHSGCQQDSACLASSQQEATLSS